MDTTTMYRIMILTDKNTVELFAGEVKDKFAGNDIVNNIRKENPNKPLEIYFDGIKFNIPSLNSGKSNNFKLEYFDDF